MDFTYGFFLGNRFLGIERICSKKQYYFFCWDRGGTQIVVQHQGIQSSWKKLSKNSRPYNKPILVIKSAFPCYDYFTENIKQWNTSTVVLNVKRIGIVLFFSFFFLFFFFTLFCFLCWVIIYWIIGFTRCYIYLVVSMLCVQFYLTRTKGFCTM